MKRRMVDDTSKKTIQRYYSIRAKDYDRQKSRTWKSEKGFGAEVLDEVLSAFTALEDKLLLEVGVGSGRNAKPLLERIKPHLVGLDLTKEMLSTARKKLVAHREHSDLVLGDSDHMPFIARAFDAILCMSTMHYFRDQEKTVGDFAELLKKGGTLVYGDLSPHEEDDQGFFEKLERTISKAHAKYHKASKMKRLLETHGFHVSKTRTIAYVKSYDAMIEDKGEYFSVGAEVLDNYVGKATKEMKEQYALTDTEMTLFYTVITAAATEN